MLSTLISVAQLRALQNSAANLRIFDVSFDLMQPALGRTQFLAGHIPGAQHADLDKHLSTHDESVRVNGGRHPLPAQVHFANWLGSVGVADTTQVVVYDRNGMNYCARLWWMLKWCGHEAVAVLDGGWDAWQAAGGEVATGEAAVPAGCRFSLRSPRVQLVDRQTVFAALGDGQTIVDARGAPRFRGEVEPLDPVAGHIPGAINRPFSKNFAQDGCLKSPALLRAEFEQLLAGREPQSVVHHCGSGVSAVPNLLAMEVAGLGRTSLYAGSWSEWCTTQGMPVAKG